MNTNVTPASPMTCGSHPGRLTSSQPTSVPSGVQTARIALYNTNFGDASRSLEEARIATERAIERLRMAGREDDAKQLEAAIVPVRDAQQLAGKLDLAANSRAADAEKVIDGVLRALPAP